MTQMTESQRTITGLLSVTIALLVLNLVIATGTRADALQATIEPADENILPVPEPPAPMPVQYVPEQERGSIPAVLRTRALEIVDDAGRVLVRIGVDSNGEAGVVTSNANGMPLTVFGVYQGGGMISTFDANGRPLVVMSQDHHGRGKVMYGGGEEKDRR